MTKFKPFIVLAALLFAVTLIVPSLLVIPFTEGNVSGKLGEELKTDAKKETAAEIPQGPAIEVGVYRLAQKKLETVPLEDYIVGVVASEMPAEFEEEALKAQALAARTFIVKQLMNKDSVELPEGALVYDTVTHQVYKNDKELRQQWKQDYKWKIEKVREAVTETQGQILTFDGSPITASFFSTSNGFTENSEAIWPNSVPYLKSVESKWDLHSPKFNGREVFTVQDFERKLGVQLPNDSTIGTVTERTAGQRVAKVDINGKVVSGKDIREKLGLKSTDFTWERKGDNIIINTQGYGHGVGMSQYGANGMAVEGKSYKEIVAHYYKGVEIAASDQLLTKVTAKK
ncbi:stage II sporulation protein D [Bacillus firmus]|uniref:stage II sporulation protein D n=1 Tax=Cytobacillus firmus TaxID=1399 RepID=UPI0015803C28|nr:stage II sporulation protein D [Cytobacillus firmus]MBG9547408.1 stage II sporulation protein D [Cytobacillus firmus]MBG9603738.1 stage II sporulation protein D [Cytobacillus firmus]MED1941038.1 stage II sporulation protein D [Cytobacillus firmus]NUH83732.1 stage II sporulation protein D [Cytobacillus firmus]